MCGITGIYNFDNQKVSKDILANANGSMFHRGPDDEGYFLENNFGMAMRRLSIIDLSKSIQPFFSECKKISLIFNGEIYNYIELRKMLAKQDINFKTNGDTEVILRLYEKYGPNFTKYLNGMFSICIFDNRKSKKIFVFRDRFGIKPLYFYKSDTQFSFASDLNSFKPILKNIRKSKKSFLLFLALNFFPDDRSVYSQIKKLRPGEYIKIEDNKFYIQNFTDEGILYDTKFENLIDLINDSIKINLRSDVGVGLMLSSGIDSSILAYEISKLNERIKCYTVDYENKKNNEYEKAYKLSNILNLKIEKIYITEEYLKENMRYILSQMDEPCADSAIIASYLISKKAKEDGLKVLISGAGGDEIFGGYNRYFNKKNIFYGLLNIMKFNPDLINYFLPSKFKGYFFKLLSKEYAYTSDISGQNLGLILSFLQNKSDKDFLLSYLEKIFLDKTNIENDLKYYLPDNILMPFDKVTMLNSIEGRVPLLDQRFLEFFKRKQIDVLKNGDYNNNKPLLREAYKDKLPEFVFKTEKTGFNAPINTYQSDYLDKMNHDEISSIINLEKLKNRKSDNSFNSFFYNLDCYLNWSRSH